MCSHWQERVYTVSLFFIQRKSVLHSCAWVNVGQDWTCCIGYKAFFRRNWSCSIPKENERISNWSWWKSFEKANYIVFVEGGAKLTIIMARMSCPSCQSAKEKSCSVVARPALNCSCWSFISLVFSMLTT